MKKLLPFAATALIAASLSTHALAEEAPEASADITGSISQTAADAARAPAIEDMGFNEAIAAHILRALGDPPADEGRIAGIDAALRALYSGTSAPIWVSEAGPNQKASNAAKEMARADDYGLDPEAYRVPGAGSAEASRSELAKYELAMTRAVLAYAHHAKAGRIDPAKVRHSLNFPESLKDPGAFLASLRTRDDVAEQLRALHPTHPQFIALQKKLMELRGAGEESVTTKIPDGPVLRAGMTHEIVALLRKRLKVKTAEGADANKFGNTLKDAVIAFQKKKGLKSDGIVGAGTRRTLNTGSNKRQILRILVNMERWRWLPDDMGGGAGIFVWANIPEFRVRVVKGGEVVFTERAIVGKRDKQTPVFSDAMEWIEFHPVWYVPNSIKVADIAPSLRRLTSTVVSKYHLKINCGALGSDWKKIDWNKTDIRKCGVSQPPGPRSVLGNFKFKFPNAHIVYIHDTPQKNLFKSATRAYSHGCVRIQNPRRMAEILLGNDKGMTPTRIGAILNGPKRPYTEKLNRFVPVHMTYFTAVFDDDGAFKTKADIYGHDRRLAQALTGQGNLLSVPAVKISHKRKPRPKRTTQNSAWDQPFSAN
ncbi:MAG: L,D-transpeptidase family protein [Alphaproteobacteria bacterium]